MSKLVEKIVLNHISDNLVTNPNQFGFKPKHITDMCIVALLEAILNYRALNSIGLMYIRVYYMHPMRLIV